nr:reverse transcriptase domain-containing protein [Tanacetum cinerariifolium]
MSASTHPIIVAFDSNVEDAFSYTNTPNHTSASPDSSGNTSPDPLEDLSKYLLASLAISPFYDDLYMKVMQAYNATKDILPPQKRVCLLSSSSTDSSSPPQVFETRESPHKTHLERHKEQIETILNHLDELPLERIEKMKDNIEGLDIMDMINNQDIEYTISPTPPLDYPLMNYLSGRDMKPLESKPDTEKPNEMAPKRTSTSAAPAMTQVAIRKLVADSLAASLEAQAATMANTDNTNRNIIQRKTPVARKCSYKDNCTKDCKVKFAIGTLTEEALSWWNSFAQPIRIEKAYKIIKFEFKKLLIKKYCPQNKVKKMEDEFYNLTVKGNDLKTYVRRFLELAVLCPTMVPNSKKLMEVFIGGLPRSIEGNVIASKPQTLEEAITIS